MDSGDEAFPNDIAALKAALAAARDRHFIEAARAAYAEAELAVARARASDDQALIAHQRLRIEKLTRELYGPRSSARRDFSIRSSCSSRNWRARRPKTRSRPRWRWPRPRRWRPSPASARRASRSPNICRASG